MTTLGELIQHLEGLPPDAVIEHGGFDGGSAHSYRGYYERLAFEPIPKARVSDMLAGAKAAVGRMFQGYKGGAYMMGLDTTVHIANYGTCDDDDDEDLLARLQPQQPSPIAQAIAVLEKRRTELTDRIRSLEVERDALTSAIKVLETP